MNALALLFGVGVVEELLFRGWLWRELQMIGPASAMGGPGPDLQPGSYPLQPRLLADAELVDRPDAAWVVSLPCNDAWTEALCGDAGSVRTPWWIGRRLVSSAERPASDLPDALGWLVGPRGGDTNPLGGVIGIMALSSLLMIQLTAVARAARPATGARKAS